MRPKSPPFRAGFGTLITHQTKNLLGQNMGEESTVWERALNDLDSYVFKVYVNDPRRFDQVQEMMDGFEIGSRIPCVSSHPLDLEWDGFEVKKDRQGGYIEASHGRLRRFTV